jgi:hypothetical protein
MPRKKPFFPKAKTATGGPGSAPADARAAAAASRAVSINTTALRGESKVRRGDRVQIASGLYEGEFATVESLAGGVVPAVEVRTDAGRTRRVRAIDLVPAPAEASGDDPEG